MSSEVLRMASMAPIVNLYFPELKACQLGLFLLQKNTQPRRMLYVNEAVNPVSHHGPLCDSICELAVGSWLLGYWRMRTQLSPRDPVPRK